jgi:pimeloyl-ACP methyl ester carboxylesterase
MNDLGFMLVHGGGHDARCWARLTPHLNGPTLAVDLPGRGARPAALSGLKVTDLVEAAVADLDAFRETEKVVLVGHSMAGITIPAVAARRPDRVAHMVFLSCFVPREGAAIADELTRGIRLVSGRMSQRPPQPPPPLIAKYMFCNDMDAEQTAYTLSLLVPEGPGLMGQPVSRTELPPTSVIPRTYVKLLRDQALRPKTQDRFIANLGGCQVRTLDSGHGAMISHPVELAAIVNDIKEPSQP